MKIFILKLINKLIGRKPTDMEMVQYWKKSGSVAAKLTKAKDGSSIMFLEGEKYPFPTFPRGHILFGPMSKLKHEIKNQVFNDSWWALEDGKDRKVVIDNIKTKLFGEIAEIANLSRFDMVPSTAMTPSVREIHRAWTKVSPKTSVLRDYLCFILQEDDAYRFRVQWIAKYFYWLVKLDPVRCFKYSLTMLEHAEIVGDMKERIRLLRRILMLCLEDPDIRESFTKLFREIDWNKVRLTKGDKYHFRGKYFKVDYPEIEY